MENRDLEKMFVCGNTNLSREDILNIGYRGDKVNDETMQHFAECLEEEMKNVFGEKWQWSDEYSESVWWNKLSDLCYSECEYIGDY